MEQYINNKEYNQIILDLIGSKEEINKFFNNTYFASDPDAEAEKYKQAFIHGLVIAVLHTSKCKSIFFEEKEWINKKKLIQYLKGKKYLFDENFCELTIEEEKEYAWEISRNSFIESLIHTIEKGGIV